MQGYSDGDDSDHMQVDRSSSKQFTAISSSQQPAVIEAPDSIQDIRKDLEEADSQFLLQ